MANSFSSDATCVMWLKLDGNLLDSGLYGNHLSSTATAPVFVTANPPPHNLQAISFEADVDYRMWVNEDNLSNEFPFKKSATDGLMTVCYYHRINSTPFIEIIWCYEYASSAYSFRVENYLNSFNAVLNLPTTQTNAARFTPNITSQPLLESGEWSHTILQFDGTKGTAGEVWWQTKAVSTGGTYTAGTTILEGDMVNNLLWSSATSKEFVIGRRSICDLLANSYVWPGVMGEVVVFNRLITTAEMDSIRAGTFGASTGGATSAVYESDLNLAMSMGL